MSDMPGWLQIVLGQGGSLALLALISKAGFSYFTKVLERQENRSDKQNQQLHELHLTTLTHIQKNTEMLFNLNSSVKELSDTCKEIKAARNLGTL